MDDLDKLIQTLPKDEQRAVAKRADMKLSTLRDYVESPGGRLKIVADVAGKKVDLSCIAERSRHGSKV
ncbi:MAG: hypothetical protein H5U22_23525 [Rhizobium sp.]|jgi:hypothetical protein|nr:hypothetical protein [Rhizobium sp.]